MIKKPDTSRPKARTVSKGDGTLGNFEPGLALPADKIPALALNQAITAVAIAQTTLSALCELISLLTEGGDYEAILDLHQRMTEKNFDELRQTMLRRYGV